MFRGIKTKSEERNCYEREEERKEFLEKRGWELAEVERLREEGRVREELWEKERRIQREERWERIRESMFNRWYGMVKGEGLPDYLKEGWEESRWQRVAGFKLESDMTGGRNWEEEEGRRCRVCGGGEEDWEHMWEECADWGSIGTWQEMVGKVLGGERLGEK